jgi:AP-1 complex subunit beta-1
MGAMDHIQNQETIKALTKKMAPPLVTLLTTKEPEIQYVALRNINLIVQKRPSILHHELRVFFIKYNDPIYVKMEKLEIMIMLASEKNIEQVLSEFKEAASEVDVEFVRKSVRAIGRCAIKIDKAAERCIQVLLELIQTKVNYVVQEAIIVIKDIFRKYPNRYESIIATLCENLDTLDEPEAKASMIWIIGEYAERIENADELLQSFLDSFHDENAQVQLQILTAIVKLFIKRPANTQEMVQKVLNLSTQETDNPDLRDRGYVYWRLLSTDPEAAKSVVLGEKPLISDSTIKLEESLLEELLGQISTLASVYHRPPEAFVSKLKEISKPKKEKRHKDTSESLLPKEDDDVHPVSSPNQPPKNLLDLDILSEALPSNDSRPVSSGNPMDDLSFLNSVSPSSVQVEKEVVLPAERGQGMQVAGAFSRRQGVPYLDLSISNRAQAPLSQFAIKFNVNT